MITEGIKELKKEIKNIDIAIKSKNMVNVYDLYNVDSLEDLLIVKYDIQSKLEELEEEFESYSDWLEDQEEQTFRSFLGSIGNPRMQALINI